VTYFIFYILAATAATAALLVVFSRRAVYSALALIVCFGAMAGLFFQLGAEFIAAIQVIVYAGAIMVLFLFVIMLLDPESEIFLPNQLKKISIFALPLGTLFAFLILGTFPLSLTAETDWAAAPGGDIATIGRSLFLNYLLPFEVTSILILVAILGAVVLTKQPDR
jgi:NADH-quinone oxidoreductase subunit J